MALDGDAPRDDGIEGLVERLDETTGVVGWAIRRDDPTRVLTIELWAGDMLLAATETGGERPDVCAALGIEGQPGFAFDPAVTAIMRDAAERGLDGDLIVRASGSEGRLASLSAGRSLNAIRVDSLGGPAPSQDMLRGRLSQHRHAARAGFDEHLAPLAGRAIGFVDEIALDESGLIWIVGWMAEDAMRDRPLVIVDDGQHAAGFAYAMMTRGDLPPGTRAFVGVLDSDWIASPDRMPHFYLADGSARFLESPRPTPLRTKAAIAPIVLDLLARCEDPMRDILRDLFDDAQGWTVIPGPPTRDRLQIDEVAILPGFGAFVNGWSISPSKEAVRFALKARDRILLADPRTLSVHRRADLADVYLHADLALDRAGFTALFRGDLADAGLDEMVAKVTWSDGSATNAAVDPGAIRILGVTAPLERAAAMFPAIETEYFFPDFARRAAAFTAARAGIVTAYEKRSARRVLVLAAPDNASDVFLMLDGAIRHAASLPGDWGIAIVARADHLRPLVLRLFADLRHRTGRACSLFFAAQPVSSEVVAPVAEALGADDVAYVAPGVVLTAAGWDAIGRGAGALTLLEVADPTRDGSGEADLSAFACAARDWRAIVAGAAPRIGGGRLPRDRAAAATIVPAGAIALGPRRLSPLVQHINAVDEPRHG